MFKKERIQKFKKDRPALYWSILAVVALAFVITALSGLGVLTLLDTLLRTNMWFILLFTPPMILVYTLYERRRRQKYTQKVAEIAKEQSNERHSRLYGSNTNYVDPGWEILNPAHIIAGVLLVLGFVYGMTIQGYLEAHAYSERAIQTSNETTSFYDRTPWVVGNSYASRGQGDDVGDRGDVNHVPVLAAGESSRYTTVITARGFMGNMGYSVVREYDLPKVGRLPDNIAHSCAFAEGNGLRWGATWPWRSLDFAISFKNPLLHWDGSDMYGYCKGDKPIVVMPLWKYDGFLVVTKVPAGAAVYDENGLRILSPGELESEKIEGLTYPQSLVTVQRQALGGMGTLQEWFSGSVGYDVTDKDHEDANAENNTEFSLVGTDNTLYSVTPLTPRGSSQSITALMVAPGRQVNGDNLKYRIETKVNLAATSTILTNIKSASVAGDMEWTTRWASGMKVYEIVPAQNGHWVASIGLGQEVSYRADIAPDGAITVVKLNSVGTPEATSPSVTVTNGKDLASMSNEELLNLIRKAAEELSSREKS